MTVLQRKTKRPLQHSLLWHWEFRPALGHLLFGTAHDLMLHQVSYFGRPL
jgi:hypothetical protein